MRQPGDDLPADVPFASNAVRLSAGEWLVAAAIAAAVLALLPAVWPAVEPLDAGLDTRLPYRLGEDYWVFARRAGAAARRGQTMVVGDSVVWGHYVPKDRTLSAWLNAAAGGDRFANLGVDGIHPAALEGLIEYYGGAVRGRSVVLHLNLLWMSSRRHDLSDSKEFAFNHPALVPQFVRRPPCYRETVSQRLGIVVGRQAPFVAWADHLRIAYFGGRDLASWTLDHPYACPVGQVTLRLPSPDEPPVPPPDARPWTEKGIPAFGPAWVDLGESVQWAAFRRTVDGLAGGPQGRVFVVIGPFNEHMLEPESLATYKKRKADAAAWLRERGVPHLAPDPLPSRLYADASHPLAEGYRLLAEQLAEDAAFRQFNEVPSPDR